jgi:ribosomal protein L37AE/L43A
MPLFEVCKHDDHEARMLLTKSMKDQDGELTQIWRCEECKKIKVTTAFGPIEDIRKMPPDQLPKNPFG